MKQNKILFSIICFLIAGGAFSQITLNSNNFPVGGLHIGRGFVISYVNVLGNPGANQFYDFTNVVPVIHDSVKYYNSSQTPWASYHPGATIANAEKNGDIYYVYYYTPAANSISKTGLTLIGDFGQGWDTVHGNYSDPDVVLSNLYTYGYATTEYATATINNILSLVNYQMKIKRNVHVDGWGQLETPLNYYADVLRVKCVEYRYDTALYFTTPVYTVADTQYYYNYYAKDVRHPVVKAHTDKLYNLQYFEYIYTPPVITGCMDPLAVNYNPMANQSDGNCIYCSVNYSITPDTAICEGSEITLNINGGNSYLWSDGSTGSSLTVTPTESCVFSVYISDSPNCWALATVEVTVDKPVTASFWTTHDQYNTGEVIQFVNLSENASNYLWSFDDAVDGFSSLLYPMHTYTSSGMKYIKLIASNTCYSDSIRDSLTIYDAAFVNNYAATNDVTIYPNPGKNFMTITGNSKEPTILEIIATDMLGRKNKISYQVYISGEFVVQNDMSHLPCGIYILEINLGDRIFVKKWIKMQ